MRLSLLLLTSSLLLLTFSSGCIRDNGTATFDPITDAEYQEALTNGNACTR
jgi:hypothetical protein